MNPLARLTLDGATEPVDYFRAINAFMQVVAQAPNQEVGNGGAIPIEVDGLPCVVVRNPDSYTVRIGQTIDGTAEEVGGIPV